MKNIWKNALKSIKTRGVLCFLLRGLMRATFFIINRMLDFFLWPFCWIMNIRFLPVNYSFIGHLAGELDCYIKEGLLGLRPQYKPILLLPQKGVANSHLLTYWGKYVCIIKNSLLFLLLFKYSSNAGKLTTYNVCKYFMPLNKNVAFPEIQKEYYGRPPLLSLTDFDRKRGWEALSRLGIHRDAWFVCVHCREEKNPVPSRFLRDADIDNYLLAMEEIAKRGGWVLRMGEAAMKPIPAMKNVIDYAHLDIKSDWMDVFLCASCRLFLGSNSGLSVLSSVFGVPSAIANATVPYSVVLSYGPEDIGIPKLIWSLKEKRYFTFKEILHSSPWSPSPTDNFRSNDLFAANTIQVIENSPEDIKEVMIEMLDRLEGKLKYSEEDERLQSRFKSLIKPTHYSYGAISRVGRAFLKKYEHLL